MPATPGGSECAYNLSLTFSLAITDSPFVRSQPTDEFSDAPLWGEMSASEISPDDL